MGAAADAITDVLPPPTRPAPAAPAAAADKDQPSFNDHLNNDAGSVERPDRPDRPDRPARAGGRRRDEANANDDSDAATAAASQAATPPTQKVAPSPLITLALAHDGDQHNTGEDTPASGDVNAAAPVTPARTTTPPPPNAKTKANPGRSIPASIAPQTDTTATAEAASQTSAAPSEAATAQTSDTQLPPPTPSPADPTLIAVAASAAPVVAPPQTSAAQAPTRSSGERPRADATPTITALAADAKPEAPKDIKPKDAPKTADDAKTQSPKDNFAALLALAHDDNGASNSGTPSSALAPPANAPRAEAAPSATPAAAAAAHTPVASQIGHEIIRKFNGGSTKFEMRLDPPELGRVDVRLEVSRDHKVTAVISADSPQALRELSRNSRDLEQSLQSAGLELADDGLSFDLSDHQSAFDQADQSNSRATPQGRGASFATTDDPTPTAPARPLSVDSWRGVRVDLVA